MGSRPDVRRRQPPAAEPTALPACEFEADLAAAPEPHPPLGGLPAWLGTGSPALAGNGVGGPIFGDHVRVVRLALACRHRSADCAISIRELHLDHLLSRVSRVRSSPPLHFPDARVRLSCPTAPSGDESQLRSRRPLGGATGSARDSSPRTKRGPRGTGAGSRCPHGRVVDVVTRSLRSERSPCR